MTYQEYLLDFSVRIRAFAETNLQEVANIAGSIGGDVGFEVSFFVANMREIYGFYLWETAEDILSVDSYLVRNYVDRSFRALDTYIERADIIVDTYMATVLDIAEIGSTVHRGLADLASSLASALPVLAESVAGAISDFSSSSVNGFLGFASGASGFLANGFDGGWGASPIPFIVDGGRDSGGGGASGGWSEVDDVPPRIFQPRVELPFPPLPLAPRRITARRARRNARRGGCLLKRFPKLGEIFAVSGESSGVLQVWFFSNFREIEVKSFPKIWYSQPAFADTSGFRPSCRAYLRGESFGIASLADDLSFLFDGGWCLESFGGNIGADVPCVGSAWGSLSDKYYLQFVECDWLVKDYETVDGGLALTDEFVHKEGLLPSECSTLAPLVPGDTYTGTYYQNRACRYPLGKTRAASGFSRTIQACWSSAVFRRFADCVVEPVLAEPSVLFSNFLDKQVRGVENYVESLVVGGVFSSPCIPL